MLLIILLLFMFITLMVMLCMLSAVVLYMTDCGNDQITWCHIFEVPILDLAAMGTGSLGMHVQIVNKNYSQK